MSIWNESAYEQVDLVHSISLHNYSKSDKISEIQVIQCLIQKAEKKVPKKTRKKKKWNETTAKMTRRKNEYVVAVDITKAIDIE